MTDTPLVSSGRGEHDARVRASMRLHEKLITLWCAGLAVFILAYVTDGLADFALAMLAALLLLTVGLAIGLYADRPDGAESWRP